MSQEIDITPPAERPTDALLASYVAGSLSPPLVALVAAHLELKADNRAFVENLETASGLWLDSLEPVPLPDRDRRLQEIFSTGEARFASSPRQAEGMSAPRPGNVGSGGVLPSQLRRYIGRDLSELKWHWHVPGLWEAPLGKVADGRVGLLWCRPGIHLPAHTHEGREVVLVLQGGYNDTSGHYRRGDIAITDAGVAHRPFTDRDEDCIGFIVVEGRSRLTGRVGRIVQRLLSR